MTRDINFIIENPVDGNKKILDFLGLKMKDFKLPFGDQEAGKIIKVVDADGKFGFVSGYRLEHLKFHTSYDCDFNCELSTVIWMTVIEFIDWYNHRLV